MPWGTNTRWTLPDVLIQYTYVVVLAAASLIIPCLMPPLRDQAYGRGANAEGGKFHGRLTQ